MPEFDDFFDFFQRLRNDCFGEHKKQEHLKNMFADGHEHEIENGGDEKRENDGDTDKSGKSKRHRDRSVSKDFTLDAYIKSNLTLEEERQFNHLHSSFQALIRNLLGKGLLSKTSEEEVVQLVDSCAGRSTEQSKVDGEAEEPVAKRVKVDSDVDNESRRALQLKVAEFTRRFVAHKALRLEQADDEASYGEMLSKSKTRGGTSHTSTTTSTNQLVVPRIIINNSFCDQMNEKENKSLLRQLSLSKIGVEASSSLPALHATKDFVPSAADGAAYQYLRELAMPDLNYAPDAEVLFLRSFILLVAGAECEHGPPAGGVKRSLRYLLRDTMDAVKRYGFIRQLLGAERHTQASKIDQTVGNGSSSSSSSSSGAVVHVNKSDTRPKLLEHEFEYDLVLPLARLALSIIDAGCGAQLHLTTAGPSNELMQPPLPDNWADPKNKLLHVHGEDYWQLGLSKDGVVDMDALRKVFGMSVPKKADKVKDAIEQHHSQKDRVRGVEDRRNKHTGEREEDIVVDEHPLTIVVLSPDAEDVLDTIDPLNEVYCLGGLVDATVIKLATLGQMQENIEAEREAEESSVAATNAAQ